MSKREEIMESRKWKQLRELLNNNGYFEEEEVQEIIAGVKTENLKDLIRVLQEEVDRRENKKREFTFEFEGTGGRRSQPYVARLVVKGGKLERQFKKLFREYQGKEIYVYGKYTAAPGQIIEKRLNGEDERYWYLILKDGSEKQVASIDNPKEKQRVVQYLMGQITADKLVE